MASLKYQPEIDGLRAIAVVAVVLYHADPRLLPGGFVGVDVFFVISGYLITALLAEEWQRTGRLDFMAFYARRVRRLLPALTVLVLAVSAAALLLLGRHGVVFEQTGESGVAALLLVSNFYFQANTDSYFSNPSEVAPLLHLWSLSVEEQYYLVYPALLAGLLKWVPGGVARRLAALSLLSLLLAEYWVHILPQRAFYQMPARFWELAAGGIVALSVRSPAAGGPARWFVPAGALAILAACVWTPAWGSFPGIGAVPAVLGSVLVLLGIHRGQVVGWVAAVLRSRGFVGVGLVSYSLYLWHWPLLAIDTNLRLDAASSAWRLLLCLFALGLAWLSWRYVEQPFRRPRRLGPPATVLAGLAVSLLAAAAVTAMAAVDRVPVEARRMAESARRDQPAIMAKCHYHSLATFTGLQPAACRSLPAVEPTIALWGDSHAMGWQPFVWRVAEHAGESAASATMNGCRPGAMPRGTGALGRTTNCTAMNERVMAWLESGQVQTLVIAMRWPVSATAGRGRVAELDLRIKDLDAALGRLRGLPRVLLMGPLPSLRRPAPTCLSVGWTDQCAMTRQEHEAATAEAWRALEALARAYPNVELVDPTAFFCDASVCPVARDGYALYWDSHHISATAAREFAGQYLQSPARYTRPPHVAMPPSPQESP